MQCWICGNAAGTGEHKTKASNLREVFGSVDQKNPLYLHTDTKRNQKVGSIKSDKFMFDSLICAQCNNDRTSPYDRAWEKLSKFLLNRKPPIKNKDLISLNKVFPGAIQESMLFVHLFFVKLFGCAISEHGVPIDIRPFSEAILKSKPHPKVFLAIGEDSGMGTGLTDMATTQNKKGKVVYATWFYIVGSVAVNVIYLEPAEKREGLVGAWHPSKVSKYMAVTF
jgi:hypothetical protein